ncbi:MAG: hypothetical protein PHH13_00695 [Candidatus Peribacteraceae bacterium]|nr:hypothetical protein [Candidatus Peribacteraceae bacterium]
MASSGRGIDNARFSEGFRNPRPELNESADIRRTTSTRLSALRGVIGDIARLDDRALQTQKVHELSKEELKQLVRDIRINLANLPDVYHETWMIDAIGKQVEQKFEETDSAKKKEKDEVQEDLRKLEVEVNAKRGIQHQVFLPREWSSTRKIVVGSVAAGVVTVAALSALWAGWKLLTREPKNTPSGGMGWKGWAALFIGGAAAVGVVALWRKYDSLKEWVMKYLDVEIKAKVEFIKELTELHSPAIQPESLPARAAELTRILAQIKPENRKAFLLDASVTGGKFTEGPPPHAFTRTIDVTMGSGRKHKVMIDAAGKVTIEKVDAPRAGPEAVPTASGSAVMALLDIHRGLAAGEGLRTDTARQGVVTLMENPALHVADIPLKDLLDTTSPAFAGHLGRMPDELSKSALRFLAKVCQKDIRTNGLLQNKSVKSAAGVWQPIDLNALTLGRYLDYVGPAMRTIHRHNQACKRHPLGFAPVYDRHAFQEAFREISPDHSILAEDLRSADGREALRTLDSQLEPHRDAFINLLSTIGANPMSMYNDAMIASVPEPQRAIFRRALTALKGKFNPPPRWLTRYGPAFPTVVNANGKLTEALQSLSIRDAMQLWFMRQQAYIQMPPPDDFDDASVPANHQALGRLQLWLKVVELIARVDPVVAQNYYKAVINREPSVGSAGP